MADEKRSAADVAMQLVRELHRRQTHYTTDPHGRSQSARIQVEGELIGLRVSLGVALGYEAASGDVVPAAVAFYQRWIAADMPQVMTP